MTSTEFKYNWQDVNLYVFFSELVAEALISDRDRDDLAPVSLCDNGSPDRS